jgi:arginyl-tRNA synthetase
MSYISLADTILDLVEKALDRESLPPECNVSTPPQKEMGDLSFACYPLAKTLRKAPAKIAEELSQKISGFLSLLFSEVRTAGPYLNFFISSQELARRLLSHISDKGERYGSAELEQPQTVVIDYSSPNVAKPFGIGHLRSTNIGGALARIYRFLGWKVIGINYLGDWGTSYGLLIEAFLKSGNEEELRQDPIEYAYRLYVDYRQKAQNDPSIIEQARRRFRLLEEGEVETQKLWRMFR